ncbi:hypothetical protein ANN_06732 [Periplaneta americana]|uniref:Uncharacterized protein n=1 Tax=Periplaneta americana TaxID=6978 RepID=A0ABQ8TG65_PERAM|nr:hypothetical protein ANN_06732 [Periplaneta americana]
MITLVILMSVRAVGVVSTVTLHLNVTLTWDLLNSFRYEVPRLESSTVHLVEWCRIMLKKNENGALLGLVVDTASLNNQVKKTVLRQSYIRLYNSFLNHMNPLLRVIVTNPPQDPAHRQLKRKRHSDMRL